MGLPVHIHVMVELSEAAVPVSRDNVELVGVQGVWGKDLLEEVKPCVSLSFCRCVDRGDPEVFASYFEI